jgi:hypothetical protein
MSGINGDKARFHRERRQKAAKRSRNRELLKSLIEQAKPATPGSGPKAKAVAE